MPTDIQAMAERLNDAAWRLTSGKLYKITTKGDDEDSGLIIPFHPNDMQMELFFNLWHRNLVPKARQHGVTTAFSIWLLDHALWVANQRCGLVAHDIRSQRVIFRDKIRFAYMHLPDQIRAMRPLVRDSAEELMFSNGSSVACSTSLRSGTYQRVHISEYAKICRRYPAKAKEVQTGTIPSIPMSGILTIESTGEGAQGDFYNKVLAAERAQLEGRRLNAREYRLHFFPWWRNDGYRMAEGEAPISEEDHKYFDMIEGEAGATIDAEQRTWYVATRDADFPEDPDMMRQEYPSILRECFLRSTDGLWYARQMAAVRHGGRIVDNLPILHNEPCMTFWDIGSTDGTAIWVLQLVGYEFRLVHFGEWWGEPYAEPIKWLQGLGLPFSKHFLPHDAEHVRQGQSVNRSPREMLEELWPGQRFEIVPRINDLTWGISQTRDIFPRLYFHRANTKLGVAHLDGYSKKWNTRTGTWSNEPEKLDGNSEAADALRQLGQASAAGSLNVRLPAKKKRPVSWKTR